MPNSRSVLAEHYFTFRNNLLWIVHNFTFVLFIWILLCSTEPVYVYRRSSAPWWFQVNFFDSTDSVCVLCSIFIVSNFTILCCTHIRHYVNTAKCIHTRIAQHNMECVNVSDSVCVCLYRCFCFAVVLNGFQMWVSDNWTNGFWVSIFIISLDSQFHENAWWVCVCIALVIYS